MRLNAYRVDPDGYRRLLAWNTHLARGPLEPALRALGANLEALELGKERAQVRRAEVRMALRSARRRKETYDLIFIDPPYSQARDWGPELSMALPSLLRPDARVVVESDRRVPMELELALERERRYGDTSIRIHVHQ